MMIDTSFLRCKMIHLIGVSTILSTTAVIDLSGFLSVPIFPQLFLWFNLSATVCRSLIHDGGIRLGTSLYLMHEREENRANFTLIQQSEVQFPLEKCTHASPPHSDSTCIRIHVFVETSLANLDQTGIV